MEKGRYDGPLWLVNTLMRFKKLSLSELSDLWQRNTEQSGGSPLTRHQLRRYSETAFTTYGVSIDCDRRDGNRYYIVANKFSKSAEWLISSQALNRVVTDETKSDIHNRILIDEIPSGQYHLSTIFDAMSLGQALEMVYQKFVDTESYTCYVEPYCVKLHEQRWYMLARKDHKSHLQVFALDRIHELSLIPDSHFTVPEWFSASDFFASALGVYAGPDLLVHQVQVRVSHFWHQYLVTLPLHASQQLVEQHQDYSVFSYQLAITPDLINRLLSFGPNLEVLAPDSLRRQLAEAATKMHEMYQ